MPPSNKRRSLDGISRPVERGTSTLQPEYRYDHELPAPDPVSSLREDTAVDHPVVQSQPSTVATATPERTPEPLASQPTDGLSVPAKKPRRLWRWLLGIMVLLVLAAGACAAWGYSWYQSQLSPVSTDTAARVKVVIVSGSTPESIASQLESEGVVRSALAFRIYAKLSGTQHNLKAGTYSLQPSVSTPAIIDHLVSGKQDTFTIMFRPGETLLDTRKTLIKAGFAEADVDAALAKTYNRPLFAGKPASASLEGYIFGDTYEFTVDATPEMVLNRVFAEFEAFVDENDLVAAYKKQGLSLFEGITLASIVQKEVAGPDDSKQVAQVFFKRLSIDMPLGADATFVYAAKQAGKQPTVDFDSLYNTRTHKGLPPGPISAPGVHALRAVAAPAQGDYLYFVSGDDGKNHFTRTLAEHEAATRQYCIKNCALF